MLSIVTQPNGDDVQKCKYDHYDEEAEYDNEEAAYDDEKAAYDDDNDDYKGWAEQPDGERGVISG